MIYDPCDEYSRYQGWRDWMQQLGHVPVIAPIDTQLKEANLWEAHVLKIVEGEKIWWRLRVQGDAEGPVRVVLSLEPYDIWRDWYATDAVARISSFRWYQHQGHIIQVQQQIHHRIEPWDQDLAARYLHLDSERQHQMAWQTRHWASNESQQIIEYAEIFWHPDRIVPPRNAITATYLVGGPHS